MPRLLPPDPPVRLSWPRWRRYFYDRYRVTADHADHVTVIGPTGTGKTTLAMQLAAMRRYVVVLGTKPKDRELSTIARRQGYRVQRTGALPDTSGSDSRRVVVWPKYTRDSIAVRNAQRREFRTALDQAFSEGGWHVVIEELPYLVELGFKTRITQHLRMGRSMSSGLILCSQRPRGIPLESMSNAQHLLMFRTNDAEDLARLGGLNGVDAKEVRYHVATLPNEYDFLHVDLRDGSMVVSRFDPRNGV